VADIWDPPGQNLLHQFELEPEKYILFVGLLRPDKGVHLLIEAYKRLKTSLPLVIVGDSPDDPLYVRKSKTLADGRVRFLGYVYGKAARQLFALCLRTKIASMNHQDKRVR
jgi:glycosyltransferase involved in cell wall biosynthesis